MLRFSIREMLLLTLVVALIAGWFVDHRQLRIDVATSGQWRTKAGALEEILKDGGWTIKWDVHWINAVPPPAIGANGHISRISTTAYQPSQR